MPDLLLHAIWSVVRIKKIKNIKMGRNDMNCWEFKKCGREAGGANAAEFGVCPAFIEKRLDGIHGGVSAGRACWVIAGTYCGGTIQGTFAEKEHNCLACDFYKLVRKEEGEKESFHMSPALMEILTA